ncbi:MAG: crotonase/enoyl-CoA hydratase family protein [Halioglobus sp.]
MTSLVTFEETEKYSQITLDDGKANALSPDMIAEIDSALDQAEAAGKVIVIAGRPGKFSAGFDLSVMGQGGDVTTKLLRDGANLSLRLLKSKTPVVLAATGHALAMGGLLLLSGDYRIGAKGNYKIGVNEVAIGMTMPYFGVILGEARLARNYISRAVVCAQLYDAEEAVNAGFLDEAVDEGDVIARAQAVAEQLSGVNMEAHYGTKCRVREAMYPAMETAISEELKLQGG